VIDVFLPSLPRIITAAEDHASVVWRLMNMMLWPRRAVRPSLPWMAAIRGGAAARQFAVIFSLSSWAVTCRLFSVTFIGKMVRQKRGQGIS